jgi:hypothetical protein
MAAKYAAGGHAGASVEIGVVAPCACRRDAHIGAIEMATKAERFKTGVERRAQDETARRARKKPAPRPGAREALVAEHDRPTARVPHNVAPRVAKNGAYELEASQDDRPSRKSTRKSLTHLKTDNSLRIKAMDRTASSKSRAGRSKTSS